jgi:TonB family protein
VPLTAVGLAAVGAAIFVPKLFERSPEQVTAPAVANKLPDVKKESSRSLPPSPPERPTSDEKVEFRKPLPMPAPAGAAKSTASADSRGVIHQVLPEIPGKARSTINGSVRITVRVQVGNVVDAKLSSSGPSRYFADLALKAARQWIFSPSTTGGQAVPSQWDLRFELTSATTKVTPSRVRP